MDKCTTGQLVCMPFLDTDVSDDLPRANAELARRGIGPVLRTILRAIAATGLWWNVLWWEWCALDFRDVLIGWASNLVLLALLGLALAVLCLALGATTALGSAPPACLVVLVFHALGRHAPST